MRSNLPPEKLGLGEALERIFPGYRWDSAVPPHRSWKLGHRPRKLPHSFALDDNISKAIEGRAVLCRRSAHIKALTQLEGAGISCPYYYARLGIAFASDSAQKAVENHEEIKVSDAPYQKQFYEDAGKLSANIARFAEKYVPQEVALRTALRSPYAQPIKAEHAYENLENVKDIFKKIGELQESLNNIVDTTVHRRRMYIKQGDRDVWSLAFVTGIRRLWVELVDANSVNKTDHFKEFLKDAYTLVGGQRYVWERKLETASKDPIPDHILDHERPIVPYNMLLLSELHNNDLINDVDKVIILTAMDSLEGSKQIYQLLRDESLPNVVSSIVRRMPWSLEEHLSYWQGLPLPLIQDFLQRVKLDEM